MPRKKSISPKQTNPIPLVVAVGGGLLLLIALLMAISNNNPGSANSITAPDVQTSIPFPGVRRTTVEDARQALENGSAIFVDVRGDDVYALSHIPGALSIPLDQLETRLNELDQNQWIITYCT